MLRVEVQNKTNKLLSNLKVCLMYDVNKVLPKDVEIDVPPNKILKVEFDIGINRVNL